MMMPLSKMTRDNDADVVAAACGSAHGRDADVTSAALWQPSFR